MLKIISTMLKAAPALISLFAGKTSRQGKGIVKSGVASLTIAGLLTTGRLSASDVDVTLLLILSILETIAYLYGAIAISTGATQPDALGELLSGKGEGLSEDQAKTIGRKWLKQVQQNSDHRLSTNSLFDEDHSDLQIKATDLSQYSTHNPTRNIK